MNINIGKGLVLDVDLPRFNHEVMDHVIYIGLRNILMDAHAGVNANTVQKNGHDDAAWTAEIKAQSRAASEKKLTALYAGELRVAGERSRLDPVEAEARLQALRAIQNALRKQGKKLSSFTTEQYAAQVTKKFPLYMKNAARVVAERAKVEQPDDLLEGM
jgi:hypothetical protein